MQIDRKDKSTTETTLSVSAGETELASIKSHVLGHFRNQVRVPGFRAGTAPESIIEKYVNQQQLIDEFLEHAINQLYNQALQQESIRAISQPKIQIKKFVPYTQLEFEAEVPMLGKISLPDYKKFRITKKKPAVTARDVNSVLKDLQSRTAQRKQVERAAKAGDEAVIDFKGTDKEGKPIAGAQGSDYALLLGSGNFIPGFEENLVGLEPGKTKTFTVKFPADYGVKELQSKPVTFKVTLKKLNQLSDSKLDDSLAVKVGPFKTLAELKADVKSQLLSEKKLQSERDFENELVNLLADKTKLEVPKLLVDAEIERMEADEKRNLATRSQTWEEHLKEEGITEQQHAERHRPEAEKRIKIGVALSEIAGLEKVSVSQDDVSLRIQLMKEQYKDEAMRAELDKPDNRREVEARLMTEKTIAKLSTYAGG